MLDQIQNAAAVLAQYTATARFNSRHCSFLARQLQAVAPADLTAEQREALALVLTRGNDVDEVRKARQRLAPPALRAPRNAMVTAWSSLSGVLSALTNVPAKVGTTGEEAAKLSNVLFPEGVVFTTYDAGALWAASRVLLERIDEEGLRARLDAIVHPSVMQAAERAFEELGAAVGVAGAPTKLPAKRALLEATTRFSLAVAAYARALALKIDETDPDAIARFRDTLTPIDPLRVTGRAGTVDEGDDEDDSDPAAPTEDPNAPYVPASDDPIDNPFIR
ncbi:MAG: hypothetical protein H6724_15580 [Sandaracinus sp.]|nr:hypothetical protein [Sandaracinus sp.]